MPKLKKTCFVTGCMNNSEDNSNKLFITVPLKKDVRNKWYKAVNKTDDPKRTGNLYCCEDHFDLPNDIVNWTYFKLFGKMMILKKNVVPHIFPDKENPGSQLTEQDKELKRTWLQKYEEKCKESKKTNVATSWHSQISDYSLESSIVDMDKKIHMQLKSREENLTSQFLANSSKQSENDDDQNETIASSRLNIHFEQDLPELLIRDKEQIEKHKPLLLRKKNKIDVLNLKRQNLNKILADKLERVKNEGNIENEDEIKPEFLEIKSEEIDIDECGFEEDISTDPRIPIQPEMVMDMHQIPDSVQTFLNGESETDELESSAMEEIEIKQEPNDEAEDFEFVNMDTKSDPSFFYEDPLKVSGTNIFVVNQTEESILS